MDHLKMIAVLAFMAVSVQVQGCELNQMQLQKDGMECVSKHPIFMMQIAEHMEHPEEMAKLSFLCKYQKELVDIISCMLNKIKGCIPEEVKPYMDLLTNTKRIADAVKFSCDHKDVLQSQCMSENMMSFSQCYMARLGNVKNTMTENSDPKELICSVIRSEEKCFIENKGHCSNEFISLTIQMLEKFFPMSACPKLSSKDFANTALGRILINSEDLKFKPGLYKPYIIKN